jgi:ribose/xylose/arabinose/galactoside ABC-type transport system permease subunit
MGSPTEHATVGGDLTPAAAPPSRAAGWAPRLAAGVRARGVIVIWLALVAFFSVWAGPAFFTLNNARLVADASATTAIFGAALGLCALAGALDLSVPGTAAVAGVVCAKLLADQVPTALAVLAAIGVGVVVGLVNAVAIELGLNPLATTIGMLTALSGISALMSGNQPVLLSAAGNLNWLGNNHYLTIPAPVFVVAVIYVLGWLLLTKTYIGVRLLAVGGNADGARRIGVRVPAYRVLGFVLSGACAAIGGIVVAAVLSQASPTPDTNELFQALTAVALSGIALSGGRGSLPRVLFGALIIATLNSGLIIHGLAPAWATLATGMLLVGALAFDQGTAKMLGFVRFRGTSSRRSG